MDRPYKIYLERTYLPSGIGQKVDLSSTFEWVPSSGSELLEEDLIYGGVHFAFVNDDGIKEGGLTVAREDHRGFLGSNVMLGYNPYGWGGDEVKLRGTSFAGLPLRVMEKELKNLLEKTAVVDSLDSEVIARTIEYLPYAPAVLDYNDTIAILEDEETGMGDILDKIIDPAAGYFPGKDFDDDFDVLDFRIDRGWTDEEKKRLTEIIFENDAYFTKDYYGRKITNPGIMEEEMLDVVLKAMTDVDYELVKNWLAGKQSRFSVMDQEGFLDLYTRLGNTYIRSMDYGREYLDWLQSDGFTKNHPELTNVLLEKLYEQDVRWPDGGPMVVQGTKYDGRQVLEFGETDYDRFSQLGIVLETKAAQEMGFDEHYQSVLAGILRLLSTPTDFGERSYVGVDGRTIRKNLADQLRIMQPNTDVFQTNAERRNNTPIDINSQFPPGQKKDTMGSRLRQDREYFRYINGKRYMGSRPLQDAPQVANILRKIGYNARIIPTSKGKRVYFAKKEKIPSCVSKAAINSGVSKDALYQSFRRGYGAAITNPESVRNKFTGKKRRGGWPINVRYSPTAWGCARAKKLARLGKNAGYDKDLL